MDRLTAGSERGRRTCRRQFTAGRVALRLGRESVPAQLRSLSAGQSSETHPVSLLAPLSLTPTQLILLSVQAFSSVLTLSV
ncbi:hypothetical protein BaRGS_00001442 [Batillaria attramentaria]|uniref:Uncharacterized protein n=1 Tax=Batillaria attramentaria TaxID=370345 RepID=A0ABD0M817_9CAEN